ncbi:MULTISPECIES: hypothetical protein [Neisseria]|uniref:hypothetical protein n=1 Tax=Neisseria TaxID=482 RepID=UPI00166060ED|nr:MULTISPECIES: hypothetical protein [Neisseria]MBD0765093.1 hypothetical protein [Neisseria sp. RH3002v2f]
MGNLKSLLDSFAQFLGEQNKALKAALTANIGTAKTEAIDAAGTAADAKISTAKSEIEGGYTAAIATLKTELIGGASESLDTFKELADELNRLKEGGSSVPDVLLQKITEAKQTADEIKTAIESITLEGLKNSYKAALA